MVIIKKCRDGVKKRGITNESVVTVGNRLHTCRAFSESVSIAVFCAGFAGDRKDE